MPSRRSLPPLNALRAFEAAARLGNFKDAAKELGVTHGAISRHVRSLEDWLGPPALFRRLNRRVELTPTGVALLEETTPALDRLAGAAERHRARDGGAPAAVLRVNALATFSLRWLLPRLGEFRERHPGIEVRLTTSNDPVDALRESYDVIIRGGPDTFYGYTARMFLAERRLPVCNPRRCWRACRWTRSPICADTRCCTPPRCRASGPTGWPRLACRIWNPPAR
jgi:LysR family glycine cleavage system transcriptional activator